MLVSRNVLRVVSALQSIVFMHIFFFFLGGGLILSPSDPTLGTFFLVKPRGGFKIDEVRQFLATMKKNYCCNKNILATIKSNLHCYKVGFDNLLKRRDVTA